MKAKQDGNWWVCGRCGDSYKFEKAAQECCEQSKWDMPRSENGTDGRDSETIRKKMKK